jgi:release factor glutamine methyltransferase
MSSAEPWTVGRLLNWTADYLKGRGSESPRLDAEVLLAETLQCRRIDLYTRFEEEPGDDARAAFREFVRRRAEGMPVAYLVGRREFYSLSFRVTPDVLIPRPETELLVVAVLDLLKKSGTSRSGVSAVSKEPVAGGEAVAVEGETSAISDRPAIADVGTGSGIIAVCLARHLPNSRVTAIDVSPAALSVAAENARQHGVADRIAFVASDLFAKVPADERFHIVASNPPYVAEAEMAGLAADVRKYEPRGALVAGPRGTEVIARLIPQAAERLLPGGRLLMEISPMIHDAVCELVRAESRLELAPTIKDLARLPRVVVAVRKG